MNDINNNITIVLASDNMYAVMIAALIKSIELNHKTKEHLEFFIINDGISHKNIEKIKKSINTTITTINWIKSDKIIPSHLKFPSDRGSLPFTTYLRLFAPYIVGKHCKKLIYMDVDMLLYDDISKFYNTNIEEKIVGAVQDVAELVSYSFAVPNYKELGMAGESKYFNAGLLLIDKEKWIKNNIPTKVIDYLHNNMQYVYQADQTGLNVILYNKWHEIDKTWNYNTDNDVLIDDSSPSLIHFLSIKPIFKSYASAEKHKLEFYRVLRLTAFKDFKPKSNYQRMFKKGITKITKKIYGKLKGS